MNMYVDKSQTLEKDKATQHKNELPGVGREHNTLCSRHVLNQVQLSWLRVQTTHIIKANIANVST